jgi:hypothetical protein
MYSPKPVTPYQDPRDAVHRQGVPERLLWNAVLKSTGKHTGSRHYAADTTITLHCRWQISGQWQHLDVHRRYSPTRHR